MEGVAVTFVLDGLSGRRVLVTGHTGFKGSWLCEMLLSLGAEPYGYALAPESGSLFDLLQLEDRMESRFADVRDLSLLRATLGELRPEFVVHLAAQPLVLASYDDPVYTFDVNIMGTVNVLEAARCAGSVQSLVNVTTDKVYENREWEWPYRENDRLNGYDPYSNSKSCSELVTSSYVKSFMGDAGVAVSTVRAGNVIGGGDCAPDRIVPDCVRAARSGTSLRLRNPNSVRPYQHVLEPLSAYLTVLARQSSEPGLAGSYNIGPRDGDSLTTSELAEAFCAAWGDGLSWEADSRSGPHEAGLLRLDSSKVAARLGWVPRWSAREAVARVVEWTRAVDHGADPILATRSQISDYFSGA
jgi:CDP-glucose 4,6-dehydratase